MGGDDWDLQAVVRSCRATPAAAAAAERDPFSLLLPFSSPAGGAEIFSSGGAAVHVPQLEELYRPFFPKSQMQQPQPKQPSQSLLLPQSSRSSPPAAPSRRPAMSHHSRSKKRKNQPKRVVCHVPADAASADLWAWRKYGQKPIKGSPYPRGYYRCSSSKGCPARKQVERSRTDPGTLLITYSAEHNHPVPTHRNSLAGSTRSKFPTSATPPPPENPAASSPASSALSPTTTLAASTEEDEDDDGVLLVEDMEVAGEDELLFMGGAGAGTGSSAVTSSFFDDDGWFEEHFSASPWMNGTPAAAAAGGR